MSKDVLMIHEVTEEILSLPLENYILTFDDGLYSQFYYWDEIRRLNTEKIFFISTGFLRPYRNDKNENLTAVEARKMGEDGDLSGYISVEEANWMLDRFAKMGGHGHKHIDVRNTKHYRNLPKTSKALKIEKFMIDTERMLFRFYHWFNHHPRIYCFPFNHEEDWMRGILRKYGFKEFYGSERIPVEELLW